MLLTHDNHMQFGYNGVPMSERTKQSDVFFTRSTSEVPFDGLRTFHEECIRTARLIKKDNPKKRLHVLMSGGIDSEIVAESFLQAGISFIPTIVRYNRGLNDHEAVYAMDWCERVGIDPHIHNLNINNFLGSQDMYHFAKLGHSTSPQFAVQMYMLEYINHLDGYAILGADEPHICQFDGKIYLLDQEKDFSVPRYIKASGVSANYGFFGYTMDQIMSFIRDPHLVEQMHRSVYGTHTLKAMLYKQHFPCIVNRGREPRQKQTGFEKLQTQDKFYRQELTKRYNDYCGLSLVEYNNFIDSHTY